MLRRDTSEKVKSDFTFNKLVQIETAKHFFPKAKILFAFVPCRIFP